MDKALSNSDAGLLNPIKAGACQYGQNEQLCRDQIGAIVGVQPDDVLPHVDAVGHDSQLRKRTPVEEFFGDVKSRCCCSPDKKRDEKSLRERNEDSEDEEAWEQRKHADYKKCLADAKRRIPSMRNRCCSAADQKRVGSILSLKHHIILHLWIAQPESKAYRRDDACENNRNVSGASGLQQEKEHGPEEIELLLNRERPEMICDRLCAGNNREITKTEQRTRKFPRLDQMKDGNDGEIGPRARKDSEDSPQIEGFQVNTVSCFVLLSQLGRDEKATQHEKDGDTMLPYPSHMRQERTPEMIDKHQQNGYAAPAVECRDSFHWSTSVLQAAQKRQVTKETQ